MSPKKETNSTTSKFFKSLIIALAVLAYFGYQVFYVDQNVSPEVQGISVTNTPSPAPVTSQAATSSSDIEVYFTNPKDKFEKNTEDSIEQDLIKKIETAKVSLRGAFFEFDLDSVADALIAAHNRGVSVELVYDDEHTDTDPEMKEMIKAGIKAVPDDRSSFMHNKFLVVDDRCVWTGSFNLTVNAAYKNNENAVYICNPKLAENYQVEFSEMFANQFGSTSPSDTPYPELNINGTLVENYFAPEDDVMEKVIAAVTKAKVSIHFLAFSFTDKDLAKAMIELQKSGISISGIFETRGANTESSQCKNFLEAGSRVRLDGNSYTLHDKVIIIDSETVILGSFNFSANANEKNDENLLIVHNQSLAEEYEQEFQRLFAKTIPFKPGSLFCSTD